MIDTSPYYTIRTPVEMSGYDYRRYAYQASPILPTYLTSINYPTIYGAYGYEFAPGRFNYGVGQSEPSTSPTIYSVVMPANPTLTAQVLPNTAQTPLAKTATLVVHVPSAAEVRFDGLRTSQTGETRTFVTPPLDPATTYAYDVRANWVDRGKEVTRTRRVEFHVGDRVVVDFTAPAGAGLPTLREQQLP
jgi:uncharacterized protein (TIGR03000 family)